MKHTIRLTLLVLILGTLQGCKIVQEISGGGHIKSFSGTANCYNACVINVTGNFLETFTAVPDSGYEFTGWSDYCKDESAACTITIPAGFVGVPNTINLIANFAPLKSAGLVWNVNKLNQTVWQ